MSVILLATAGCSTVPPPPAALGDDFPGTCLPDGLTWPTDFLDALPGESEAVGGEIVGLRLEHGDSGWMWRLRSADQRNDLFGEPVDDPSAGRESVVDVRTLETIASQGVELTEAEQQAGTSILDAAQQAGETYPSPLIIEMSRVVEDGEPAWRITTCDTETSEHSVRFAP